MSVRRRMGLAALLLSAGMLGSRILGYVRDAIIAAFHGAGTETDVFWASFTVPDFMKYLLDGGALTLVFLPMFADLMKSDREDEAWNAFGVISTTTLVLATAVTALVWWQAPFLVGLAVPGFSAAELEQTVRLTRIVLPGQLFFMIGGLINATLQTGERFAETALAGLVYNGCIITGGLIAGPDGSIEGFSWGALAGAVAQCGLFFRAAHRRGLVLRPRFSLLDPHVLRYLWRSIPVLLGVSLFMADEWIARWMASDMNRGAITWLQNARRLMLVPTAMIGFATAAAALPYLTSLHAKGESAEASRVHADSIRVTAFLLMLAAAWLFAAAEPVVGLFFERRAFLRTDTIETAAALSWYAPGLVFWGLYVLVGRGFYAMQSTWTPMLIATAMTVLAVPMYLHLGGEMEHRGLALSSTLGMAATVTALLLGLHVRNPLPLGDLFVSLLRSAVVCGLAGAAGWWVATQMQSGYLIDGTVVSSTVGAVALGLALLLKVPELQVVIRRVIR